MNEIVCERFEASSLPDGKTLLRIFPVTEHSNSPNKRLDASDVVRRIEEVTGKRISRQTIYGWTRKKKNPLPFRKLGGVLFFISDEVENWISERLG